MLLLGFLIILASAWSFIVNHPTISELVARNETTVFFNDSTTLHHAIASYKGRLFIFYVARLRDDLPYYLFNSNYERLSEIFMGHPVVHLVLGVGTNDMSQVVAEALTYLPSNTIFLLNGDPIQYDICCLMELRSEVGYAPPVVFHTDQEKPWLNPDLAAGRFANGSTCYNSNMLEVYKPYKYIFRTNYYQPLIDQDNVQFIPLGAAAARYTRVFVENHPTTKASERIMWCLFSGRLEYVEYSKYHDERGDLINLLYGDGTYDSHPKQCRMLFGEFNLYRQFLNHDDFLLMLSQTVFTPCPSGNNPETFRHYEVRCGCEVMSILLCILRLIEMEMWIYTGHGSWVNSPLSTQSQS